MIRTRRARIVATLGPASRAPETVVALARAGADVFRLNFSHGSHEDHARTLEAVRAAEAAVDRPLAALADLQGPKIRLGRFADTRIPIAPGARLRLDSDPTPGTAERVQLPHPELLSVMREGGLLLVDDGKVRLEVTGAGDGWADVVVRQGSELSDRKGLALPGAVIPVPALTAKDREDLAFALRLGVDWVALSFVQQPSDMAELRRIVGGRAACLAKIEKPAALDDLGAILDLCDGVMVARGDLGVELEPEEVPVAQKAILRAARARGVPAIVATQMLESMTHSATPTRAEASDVANAVYEGADALMLSAESASGQFPLEAVTMMARIVERVEHDPAWPSLMRAEQGSLAEEDADALVAAARRAADVGGTACLITFTATGSSARRLARERALQPVLAVTTDEGVARRLALVWGLEPRVAEAPHDLEEATRIGVRLACDLGLAQPHERILILAGTPFGSPGSSNLMRFAHAPGPDRRR
ncbi:MAG: pyruvate kinase [Caulobacteraceae bacterium]|nr:pyruvate kinase [Caulobacter sp.]